MKVKVEGMGQFDISEEFIPQLLSWLGTHSAVRIKESNSVLERDNGGSFTGRELLSE
jgi:hypothetical protein